MFFLGALLQKQFLHITIFASAPIGYTQLLSGTDLVYMVIPTSAKQWIIVGYTHGCKVLH